MLDRRRFVAGMSAVLATPALSKAPRSATLRFVPQADLAVLDPTWTTIYVTRNHGYMVFDTLYGTDGAFAPVPQMVEGHLVENDGKTWRLTLRDGLVWHDGERVLARDCAASIRRWAKRDALGGRLMAAVDELAAPDDRTILFRLNKPFPLLPYALGKLPGPMPAMMPERLANTDPTKQITEMVGSGPYRFLPGERIPGAFNAYERFDRYVPRPSGKPDWTSGPKVANFARVEWTTIPDAATAAAALQNGEQDWWENATIDLLPMLSSKPQIKVAVQDPTGWLGVMRVNHTQAPFDNPAIRRALLGALDQATFMQAIVGDNRSLFASDVGMFSPAGPVASTAGLEPLRGPRDPAKMKSEILAAGYKGERVVFLIPSDFPAINAMAQVAVDMMRKCGLNVEAATTDWATMAARRSNGGPVDQGGWSAFCTAMVGSDVLNPSAHFMLRGSGKDAWFGWPTSARLEELWLSWFDAASPDAQKRVATDLQKQAMIDLPIYPLGQYSQPTAYRADLSGLLDGFATFWNVRRS